MDAHPGLPTWRGPSTADGTLTRGLPLLYFTNRIINVSVKYAMSADPLSAIFSALADPTRRAILARLSAGEATVTELAAPFEMSLPAVSKHLKVLERAGLITRGREAQWRPCRLEAHAMKDAADWLEEYRLLWEGSLDRLDEYLAELQKDKT
jgi:DNA-binding transcriptional ArsR family regulator